MERTIVLARAKAAQVSDWIACTSAAVRCSYLPV